MKLTKTLGYLGLLASIIVGLGEYLLHYSTNILENSSDYEFFKFVSLENLTSVNLEIAVSLPKPN